MTILHVDNIESTKEFKDGLSKQDVNYVHLNSINKAMDFLEKNSPELLLIGEHVNGGSGLEIIGKLSSSKYSSVPIVYIADNEDNNSSDHYLSLGIIDNIKRSDLTLEKISKFLFYIIDQSILTDEMKSLSIAVIDDSKVTHEIINTILQDVGIVDITNFSDPRDLLKYKRDFDVYFVDMVMPGITGDKLSANLRMRSSQSIIIIMSSIDNVKTISNVLSAGADDYIIKPFNRDILLARLKTNFRSFKLVLKLDKASKIDSLTGVYNHGYIFDKLHEEINNSTFKDRPLCLLLLDLDKFKLVNDQFGHPGGDIVLTELANLFKNNCRKIDYFGRYGGEEFVFIMTDTVLDEAIKITDRLRDEFSKMSIEGIYQQVTFSGGLIQWKAGNHGEEIVKKADKLLYKAKNSGRDKICY